MLEDQIRFSCVIAKEIESNRIEVNSNTVFIGRNVMSLEAFRSVKQKG